MRMWLRQATLTLGSNQYTLDGLNFSFKVQFEDRAKVSTAQLEVTTQSARALTAAEVLAYTTTV